LVQMGKRMARIDSNSLDGSGESNDDGADDVGLA
jgi:hypothetical protein